MLSLNTRERGGEDILIVATNQFFFNLSMSGASSTSSSSKPNIFSTTNVSFNSIFGKIKMMRSTRGWTKWKIETIMKTIGGE